MSAKRSGQVFDKLPQGEHPVITYVVKGETKYIISKTDYGEPGVVFVRGPKGRQV